MDEPRRPQEPLQQLIARAWSNAKTGALTAAEARVAEMQARAERADRLAAACWRTVWLTRPVRRVRLNRRAAL